MGKYSYLLIKSFECFFHSSSTGSYRQGLIEGCLGKCKFEEHLSGANQKLDEFQFTEVWEKLGQMWQARSLHPIKMLFSMCVF
jgi:hypothetical protein